VVMRLKRESKFDSKVLDVAFDEVVQIDHKWDVLYRGVKTTWLQRKKDSFE
jgi:hypothetical protein